MVVFWYLRVLWQFQTAIRFPGIKFEPKDRLHVNMLRVLGFCAFSQPESNSKYCTPHSVPLKGHYWERKRERERERERWRYITSYHNIQCIRGALPVSEPVWGRLNYVQKYTIVWSATRGANTRQITELWLFFFLIFPLESRIRKNWPYSTQTTDM